MEVRACRRRFFQIACRKWAGKGTLLFRIFFVQHSLVIHNAKVEAQPYWYTLSRGTPREISIYHLLVTLGEYKAEKKLRKNKEDLVADVRECYSKYAYIWVLQVENMRNAFLKELRLKFRDSRWNN